jgi:hypothetical protein
LAPDKPEPYGCILTNSKMKIGEPLLKILSKIYEPSTLIEQRFGRYDLAFKTDEAGRPVLLFIGQKGSDGKIKGERFSRRIVTDSGGNISRDHWDDQGRTI